MSPAPTAVPSLQDCMRHVCATPTDEVLGAPLPSDPRLAWALKQLTPLHQLTVFPAFEPDTLMDTVEQCAQHLRLMGLTPWLGTEIRNHLQQMSEGLSTDSAIEGHLTTTEMRMQGKHPPGAVWILVMGEHFRGNELEHMLHSSQAPLIVVPHPPFSLMQNCEGLWIHTQRGVVEGRMKAEGLEQQLNSALPAVDDGWHPDKATKKPPRM